MRTEELFARLYVLETFSMMALGLYPANARDDPDYSKATALLDGLRVQVEVATKDAPEAVREEAKAYAKLICDRLAENLLTLRGEGGSAP